MIRRTLSILFAISLTGFAAAQQPQAPPPDEDAAAKMEEALRELPAQIRLGFRVESTRQKLAVASAMVIVPDERSYLEILQLWSLAVRFPVLIDDGTDIARENIARFTRAFNPSVKLYYKSDNDAPLDLDSWRVGIESAVAGAWHAESYETLKDQWKTLGLVPPGIVAIDLNDSSWTGGAALAAGHGQPIAWFDLADGHVGRAISADDLAVIRSALSAELGRWGYQWRGQADDIEAVTLCTNEGSRVLTKDRPLALTDLVGRHTDGSVWAWCGQIIGSEAESAYLAMSSLFLRPQKAWLFNGYPLKDNFKNHQPERAAELFEQLGMLATIDAAPNDGLDLWRRRAERPIGAQLIVVTTSGLRKWFDLTPGRAAYSDVPMLLLPSVVQFTHSFSAQLLHDQQSIARRWIDRGAYVYIGAVDEPYLAAFQTPDNLLSRMFAGAPVGAAARLDNAEPWKVTLIGDPLATILRPDAGPTPIEGSPAVEGAELMEMRLREELQNQRLEPGVRSLVLMGRDADVARLVRTVLKDSPDMFTAGVARQSFFALFRTGQWDLMLQAFNMLDRDTRRESIIIDTMWLAFRDDLMTTTDDTLVDAMRECVRDDSIVEDGKALLAPVKRVYNYDTAVAMVGQLIQRSGGEEVKNDLRQALGNLSRD